MPLRSLNVTFPPIPVSNQKYQTPNAMPIRSINQYTVTKRFSLGKRMYDKLETIYIQEHDALHEEPQKVFDNHKEYVTDISADIYKCLRKGFIVASGDNQ